eukprot:816272-Prorocentrum_minimum.AAC.1
MAASLMIPNDYMILTPHLPGGITGELHDHQVSPAPVHGCSQGEIRKPPIQAAFKMLTSKSKLATTTTNHRRRLRPIDWWDLLLPSVGLTTGLTTTTQPYRCQRADSCDSLAHKGCEGETTHRGGSACSQTTKTLQTAEQVGAFFALDTP